MIRTYLLIDHPPNDKSFVGQAFQPDSELVRLESLTYLTIVQFYTVFGSRAAANLG